MENIITNVISKKYDRKRTFSTNIIFKISKSGERVDPPLEAYNSINDLKGNNCLLFKIIEYIENNSNLKIHNSWYEAKESIKGGTEG